MPYLMRRGSITIIRKDSAGIFEAQSKGYVLAGECDSDGNLINENVVIVPEQKEAVEVQEPARRGRKPKQE